MLRRVEDQIRKLCNEIVAEVDEQQQVQNLVELRHALHRHVVQLRATMLDYPLVLERRIADSDIPRAQNVQASNQQEPPSPYPAEQTRQISPTPHTISDPAKEKTPSTLANPQGK